MHKQTHVDDWLDALTTDELPAKLWLEHFRRPACKRNQAWLDARRLVCWYDGKLYRVIGCSRMGDIWLTSKIENPDGYERRVHVDGCSKWLLSMVGQAVDLHGPWRLTSNHAVTGNFVETIVDSCNRPLFSAHAFPGVLARIVDDHNALVKEVRGEFEELDDDDGEIPADAFLHDDPLTDHRICNREGWAVFDVDATGLLEIQRDDNSEAFDSDAEAVGFVGLCAARSPYHAKALAIHAKDYEALVAYRSRKTTTV